MLIFPVLTRGPVADVDERDQALTNHMFQERCSFEQPADPTAVGASPPP